MTEYYNISQAANILGIAPYRLRSLEQSEPLLQPLRRRGRRYYTQELLDSIAEKLQQSALELQLIELAAVKQQLSDALALLRK